MGWTDSHLHQFMIDGQNYGDPQDDEFGELDFIDENDYRLNQLVLHEKPKIFCEYDFGDSWEHTIPVEKVLSPEKGTRYPFCAAGKNACPPEDVGGIGGYEHFLRAISNPKHEEQGEYLQWVGGHFDPQHFDLHAVNERLRHFKNGVVFEPEIFSNLAEDAQVLQKALSWAQGLPDEQFARLDLLSVRRDTITFLN